MLQAIGMVLSLVGLVISIFGVLILIRAEYLLWRKRINQDQAQVRFGKFYLLVLLGAGISTVAWLIPING